MAAPGVTFVVATYRRADALRATLSVLSLQTCPDWTAIVVGDRCDEETADAVRSVGDLRIRYYNLPTRFGEQSGPNSAGLALADREWVAFLNHDDLLLPDHVEHAFDVLSRRGGAFFVGRYGQYSRVEDGRGNGPVETRIFPERQAPEELLSSNPWGFDPSSFWVVRTEVARRAGPWRPARTLWRTPLRDWALKAWRQARGLTFGEKVTGLRFQTMEGRAYGAAGTPEIAEAALRLAIDTPDAVRRTVESEAGACLSAVETVPRRRERLFPFTAAKRAFFRAYAPIYLATGIDPHVVARRLKRRPKGVLMEELTRQRVAEGLPADPSIDDFLRDPEAHRVV